MAIAWVNNLLPAVNQGLSQDSININEFIYLENINPETRGFLAQRPAIRPLFNEISYIGGSAVDLPILGWYRYQKAPNVEQITQTISSTNSDNFVGTNDDKAQSFVPTNSGTVTTVNLKLDRLADWGGPLGMGIGIYTDSGSDEPDTLIGNKRDYLFNPDPGDFDIEVKGLDADVTGGTKYWIVISLVGDTTAIKGNSSNAYADGKARGNSSGSWADDTSIEDFYFILDIDVPGSDTFLAIFAQASNDLYDVKLYSWNGASWDEEVTIASRTLLGHWDIVQFKDELYVCDKDNVDGNRGGLYKITEANGTFTVSEVLDKNSDGIPADGLVANEAYLYVLDKGNNIIYYSDVNDGDAIDTDNSTFIPDGEILQIVTSGGFSDELFIFEKSAFYIFNTANLYTNKNTQIGALENTIVNVNGNIYFSSVNGDYIIPFGSTNAEKISFELENNGLNKSIYDQLDFETVKSWGLRGCYYKQFKQTLTWQGRTIDNPVLVFNGNTGKYSFLQYNTVLDLAGEADAEVFTINAGEDSKSFNYSYAVLPNNFNNEIYETTSEQVDDEGFDETEREISGKVITKHYTFTTETTTVQNALLKNLYFKYKAENAVTIKYALDGDTTYTTLGATLPATTNGLYEIVNLDFGLDVKTISLEMEFTGEFNLFAFGFEFDDNLGSGIVAQ